MRSARSRRLASAVAVFAAMVAVVGGCSQQSAAPDTTSTTSNSPTAAPTTLPSATTTSQFDSRWMDIDTTQPWNWEEGTRRITSDFQQFGLRPVDENEPPRRCNGCGVEPPTAFMTVYAPGKFDPTDARTGQPASVNVDNDGFFRPTEGLEDAVLAWEYGPNAWATVRGRTTMTSELDRMVELARAIRPTERTPIRAPMSLPSVPPSMPLAEISVDHGRYGTSLQFAACGFTDVSGAPDCFGEADSMYVKILPTDGFEGYIDEPASVPITVGGTAGIYDDVAHIAAVQVQPGMLVVFDLSGPSGAPRHPTPPTANLRDILASVAWAPDPGNEQTWPVVSDWAKQS